MPKAREFTGLLTGAPTPLPDDDQPPAAAEPRDRGRRHEPAASHTGVPREPATARHELDRSVTGHGTSASPSSGLAGEERVATTIRLRPPAAAALNTAWLYQRMHVNPKLSYPEFASEIVRLGLAAFEHRAEAESEAKPAVGQ